MSTGTAPYTPTFRADKKDKPAHKTWVIEGPSADSELHETGLMGPVKLSVRK